MTFSPRWYQEEAINSIYHYFMNNKSGNPVIGLPTGSGKTAIPNLFMMRVLQQWPDQRFLVISHIKELIDQAYTNLLKLWLNAPAGIYSAGIGRKEYALPIIFGGIQSMAKQAMLFGKRDIIFVDEVHMVSQDENSMYQNFLSVMKFINPHVKIIGLSATLFRMGQGHIIDNGLFTDVIYDMTDTEGFNKLIEEGYLLPVVPLRTKIQLDIDGVGIAKGDFILSQLEKKVDVNEVTYEALREACEAGKDRKSWLVFASGIDHSDHISEMLQSFNIDCVSVHSKQSKEYNDRAIKAFKNGDIKALSSYSKLSTGFDHPPIDLIIDLRPTMSVPLHIQKYGRGTRPVYAEGFNLNSIEGRLAAIKASQKQDCLCLDYSKNTPRLGFINNPVIPRKKGEGGGDPPVKVCECCGVFNHIKNKTCTTCGEEFSFEIKITKTAGFHELIKSDLPIIEIFNVDRVIYNKHQKLDKAPCLKVTYFTGIRSFTEWLFPQSMKGPGRHYFHTWWRNRTDVPPPATVEDALLYTNGIRQPKSIRVWVNKKLPEIMGHEF